MAIGGMLLSATAGLAAAAPNNHSQAGKHHQQASGQASAAPSTRPGWGCGDTNHVHTGPPGLGPNPVSPCSSHVTSPAAVHFAVSAPSSASAGTAFSFTVSALNEANNTVTSFADTIHFTSTDAAASLPADAVLTNGTGTFSATLNTAGSQTISATDISNNSITGTANAIGVSSAAAVHFAISAPASAGAGSAFSFTVTALNPSNAAVTTFGDTVHFTSSDGSASLPADATLSNGTGTFSATLHTAGNQTITVTDTTNASFTGTSSTIAVSPAAATHFSVSAPATATAGTAFNFTVTALDPFNNTATAFSDSTHFTSTDGSASLPADATLTSGTGTFAATLHTTGNQTITATDTAIASVTGTSSTVAVS
jgi:hypothetical protein